MTAVGLEEKKKTKGKKKKEISLSTACLLISPSRVALFMDFEEDEILFYHAGTLGDNTRASKHPCNYGKGGEMK